MCISLLRKNSLFSCRSKGSPRPPPFGTSGAVSSSGQGGEHRAWPRAGECLFRSSPRGRPGPSQVCLLSEGLCLLIPFLPLSVNHPHLKPLAFLTLSRGLHQLFLEPELRTDSSMLHGFCVGTNAQLRGIPWPPAVITSWHLAPSTGLKQDQPTS